MMVKSNVLVSFNSMTMKVRLNTEAAKAIQYGNLDPNGLKLVTINPAKQLKIDKYVGSLEIKKMLILLSGMVNHYLYTVKRRNVIDGIRYYSQKIINYLKKEMQN